MAKSTKETAKPLPDLPPEIIDKILLNIGKLDLAFSLRRFWILIPQDIAKSMGIFGFGFNFSTEKLTNPVDWAAANTILAIPHIFNKYSWYHRCYGMCSILC
jgi:hypothetical protein